MYDPNLPTDFGCREGGQRITKPQFTEERPVHCAACGRQMYYAGQLQYELEMVITVDFRNGDHSHRNDGGKVFYVHKRCFEGFQIRFSGSTVSPASAAPVVDEQPPRHLIGSSRHPHFTAADHERMKETLDALSDYPTEEEAEAVLQACGTSGKEVVNEFIERLLRENLELKNKLAAATAAPVEQSDSLRCACRTFTLDPTLRACLGGDDLVHTVLGCPERKVTEDNGR